MLYADGFDWSCKRVLVTGGAGFIGQHLVRLLQERGCRDIRIPRSASCDLRELGNCRRAAAGADVLFHLAAVCGGIGLNQAQPARLFYDNLLMGTYLLEAARQEGVPKTVLVGTSCSYPKHTPVPFREEDLWQGEPEETNAAYGQAKRMLLVQARAYQEQYGMRIACVLPFNAYGPGDHYDATVSHVIPALIAKCLAHGEREQAELVVWGDGSPTRDFCYVEDVARGILLAAERVDDPAPINIGTGQETSIRELVSMITALTNFRGRVRWDTSKPNGQPRRSPDITRAWQRMGYVPCWALERGLRATVQAYRQAAGHV